MVNFALSECSQEKKMTNWIISSQNQNKEKFEGYLYNIENLLIVRTSACFRRWKAHSQSNLRLKDSFILLLYLILFLHLFDYIFDIWIRFAVLVKFVKDKNDLFLKKYVLLLLVRKICFQFCRISILSIMMPCEIVYHVYHQLLVENSKFFPLFFFFF